MTDQVRIKPGFIRSGRTTLMALGLFILLSAWVADSHSQDTSTIPRSPASATAIAVSSWGTGFVVGEGYVLTALHVVQGQSVLLVGPDAMNRMVPAEMVQSDATLDLALLKARLDYPSVVFAPTTNLPTGLEISVIGFPQPRFQGFGKKITQGIINGYRNERQSAQDKGLYQISAEVSKGNSGGPVFASDGTVIGMVQRKINAKRVAEQTEDMIVNVSYALRSSQIIAFLQSGPANPSIRNLSLSTVLRPYQIFEQSQQSVVGVIGRSRTEPPAQTP